MTKEEIIKKLEVRHKSLVESLPGFVFIFDDQFILRDVYMPDNMKLLHSMKELIGMNGRVIYSPEVSEMFIHNIHGCLADGKLRELEYPVDLNNLRFYYQARIVPFEENKVLAMIQDIGDRVRRVEELVEVRRREETNLMKSNFLANMSHEIRTPLNAIVGFSEILAGEEDLGNREDFMNIIRANSNLLLQLINDILDISRIQSGKIMMYLQETNVNLLLNEVYKIHQVKMQPNIELRLIIHSEKEIWINTDPNRLKQILYNFLSNAIKYTSEGSITIQLDVEDDKSLTFSVIDTGKGIPENQVNNVFDRFEKLNSNIQGTGLGLAISKGLTEQLGGTIRATSTYGKGSTFSINLPIEQESTTTTIKEKTKKIKQKKILILEPNDNEFTFFQSAIGEDYYLTRITNEEKVVEAFNSELPNLILLDISSPDIEGIEIIKQIRNITRKIPLIVITDYGNYKDQELSFKAGCDDILLKPYTEFKLQDVIVSYI